MEKKPFRGKYSGFLYIGKEKGEFDGEKLVSYYAKPYCSSSAEVEKCIEFNENKLTIRDVHSPDGKQYDCIWEQEDIESLLDKLGKVSAYHIESICCESIKQLVIPSKCMGIADSAFNECPKLRKLLCLGDNRPVLSNRRISVTRVSEDEEDDSCHKYDPSRFSHYGVHRFDDPDTRQRIGCYIAGRCSIVDRNDVEGAKWVFFWSRKIPIEEGTIDKDVEIIGFSGSTAEAYAHAHGNRFTVIDDLTYDLTKLPDGITIEGDTIAAKGQVYLRLTGLQDTQLAETVTGTHLELICEPDEMNDMRIVFRNAETGEFCGLLANRAAYTATYLMKRGYLEFADAVTEENGYVTATILWHEPLTDKVKRQLHLAGLINNYPPYFRTLLEREHDNELVLSSAVMTAKMSSDEKKLMTDRIMIMNETENRLSCAMACQLRSGMESSNVLSAFQYTDNNRYKIAQSSFDLNVNKKTSALTCLYDDVPIVMTAAEEGFAQMYINHYRQIYHLPPIRFKNVNGGDEYGTV